MDQDALERLLECERFTLRQAVAALRWSAAPRDEADLEDHRRRLSFLLEMLARHAARLAGLASQGRCEQYAVEWAGPGYASSFGADGEALAELEDLLRRARAGDPERRCSPERLEPLLARIEQGLDEEQAAWDARRTYA